MSPENVSTSDIIVTAERRSERLENVPASVSVVSEAGLQSSGIVRFQDLGNSVIGLQISRSGSFTQPAIRGITTLTTGQGFENNVAVYVDGFYQTDAVAINGDLANIRDVQVLKGPQGTLYGRNATGGAILINTKEPADRLEGSVTAGYGSRDDVALGGYISGPIVADWLKGSLSLYSRTNDGYISDPYLPGRHMAPFKNRALRARLEIGPVDWAKVTLGYNRSRVEDPRGLTVMIHDHFPAGFIGPMTAQRDVTGVQFPTKNPSDVSEYTATILVTTPIGTLTSRTGYSERDTVNIYDFDGQQNSIVHSKSRFTQHSWQQGLDYHIDVIPRLNLLVGAYYYDDKFVLDPAYGFAGTDENAITSYSRDRLRTKAYSFYADGTYELADRLFLTLGGRYSHEKKTLFFETLIPAGSANTLAAPRSATFTGFTPRANLRYALDGASSVYASYSRGFKSGTFNPTAVNPAILQAVKPENVNAYEVGYKLARRGFRFSTAAYYYDYTDLQVGISQPNPSAPTTIITLTGNAKKAEIYGLEAELSADITSAWDVNVGAAYNHARYKDFKNATGTGVNPLTNLNQSSIQDWSGNTMVRAPAWTANMRTNYKVPMLGGRTTFTASASWTSKYIPVNASTFFVQTNASTPVILNSNTNQRFWQKAFALVNLQAEWAAPGDHFTIAMYGNNLFDKRYKIIDTANSLVGDYWQWSEPATFGVRAGYKF